MLLTTVDPPPARSAPDPALPGRLRSWVEALSFPRHFRVQPAANRRAGALIADRLRELGYEVALQGACRNVVASPRGQEGPLPLVAAHYDSVPATPGADDDASGLAVLLEVAARLAGQRGALFVAFNREEDGLLGSRELAACPRAALRARVSFAHVLEMVGYTAHGPGSQRSPLPGLPGAPGVGDFLGIVADHRSARLAARLLRTARRCDGAPRVTALRTWCGLHRHLPDLDRSDHAPLWEIGVPALLWTDTAELRSPHYHQPSDTPDTLDYAFMAGVTRLLEASLIGAAS